MNCRLPIADCRLPKLKGGKQFSCSIANRQSSIVNGFTLIEMLVVISILGILAGLTVPALKNIGKADAGLSASRQMLDAVGHARQLAISRHTTVYMVFIPPNFWTPAGANNWFLRLTSDQKAAVTNLCDRQLSGYTFVTHGTSGDQPGRHAWHYLEPWQSLPAGSFIAEWKFGPRNSINTIVNHATGATYPVQGFATNQIPFPTETLPLGLPLQSMPGFPYIAFNYLGQLTSGQDEYIPLAQGSILPAMTVNKVLQLNPPSVSETPPGNSTNAFNMVQIDWLTGRAVLRYQKLQ